MGRTNPTYRDQLRRTQEHWSDFRRALRHRDQDAYDRLWEHASNRADAAGYLNPTRPLDPILMAICISQERRITELEDRLSHLDGDE